MNRQDKFNFQQTQVMLEKTNKTKSIPKLDGASIMRQFNHAYSKKKSENSRKENEAKPNYHRKKTDSAQKISKFLKSVQSVNTISYTDSEFKKSDDQKFKRLSVLQSKRCYFKNQYCESHPLLRTQHQISLKPDLSPQINPRFHKKNGSQNMFKAFCNFVDNKNLATNPKENREMVTKIKQKMKQVKASRKQAISRVKYNYLVNNCYRPHLIKQTPGIPQLTNRLSTTKSHIFPCSDSKQTKKQPIIN